MRINRFIVLGPDESTSGMCRAHILYSHLVMRGLDRIFRYLLVEHLLEGSIEGTGWDYLNLGVQGELPPAVVVCLLVPVSPPDELGHQAIASVSNMTDDCVPDCSSAGYAALLGDVGVLEDILVEVFHYLRRGNAIVILAEFYVEEIVSLA